MHNLLEIMTFTVKNFTKLPVLRYLGVCNVLHCTYMGVFGPSLLIESTDSMIIRFIILHTLTLNSQVINGCPIENFTHEN